MDQARGAQVGDIVEDRIGNVGEVFAVEAGRVRYADANGDIINAPAHLVTVQFAALPQSDEVAADSSVWYDGEVFDDARPLPRYLWAEEAQEVA